MTLPKLCVSFAALALAILAFVFRHEIMLFFVVMIYGRPDVLLTYPGGGQGWG
jgi:hypothetical protein